MQAPAPAQSGEPSRIFHIPPLPIAVISPHELLSLENIPFILYHSLLFMPIVTNNFNLRCKLRENNEQQHATNDNSCSFRSTVLAELS